MKDLDLFLSELIEENKDLRDALELLKIRYKIIDELVEFRKATGISQTEFAEKIGVKQQMISRFEKGEVDPRLSFVAKVLVGMGVDISITSPNYKNVNNLIDYGVAKKNKRMVSSTDLVFNNESFKMAN